MEWTRERRIYPARYLYSRDGDTYCFLADSGLHGRQEWAFRLKDFDAWEKRQRKGPKATKFAEAWFKAHDHGASWPFTLITMIDSSKSDFERLTFDRFVAEVQCADGHPIGPDLKAAGMTKT